MPQQKAIPLMKTQITINMRLVQCDTLRAIGVRGIHGERLALTVDEVLTHALGVLMHGFGTLCARHPVT